MTCGECLEEAQKKIDQVVSSIEDRLNTQNKLLEKVDLLKDIEGKLTELKEVEFEPFEAHCNNQIAILEGKVSSLENCYSTKDDELQEGSKIELTPPSRIISDVCSSISLPGLRYVAEDGQHWSHRYLWLLIHLTALMISYNYVNYAYESWQNSPVIQSFQNNLNKSSDIPFPAVTFCALSSLSKEYNKLEAVERCLSFGNDTESDFPNTELKPTWVCSEEELIKLQVSLILTRFEDYSPFSKQFEAIYKLSNYKFSYDGHTFLTNIRQLLSQCYSSYSLYFVGTGRYDPCFEGDNNPMLDSVFILHGAYVCRTFNSVPQRSLFKQNVTYQISYRKTIDDPTGNCIWTPENMLSDACKEGSKPSYDTKSLVAMFLKDRTYMNKYDDSASGSRKFLVGVHNPADNPTLSSMRHFFYRTKWAADILLLPKLITAKEDLVSVDISQRRCYFSYEKELAMFKFYSRENCLLECKVNCSITECGCVPYDMPRPNVSVKVCDDLSGSRCLDRIKENYNPFCNCDCLPDCVSLSYDVDVKEREYVTPQRTMITISFKDEEFSSTVRYSITSLSEFVAYSIGILSVFNGFSLVVVWEILYLLTLRLWASIKKITS